MNHPEKNHPAPQAGNGWVSCGIPANQQEYGTFWTQWAASRDSRKCSCGCMVITGPCPQCGAVYRSEPRG